MELTLLIYKNLMCLIGLLKLNSLTYRIPFLDVLLVLFGLFTSSVLVDSGLVTGLRLYIS